MHFRRFKSAKLNAWYFFLNLSKSNAMTMSKKKKKKNAHSPLPESPSLIAPHESVYIEGPLALGPSVYVVWRNLPPIDSGMEQSHDLL